MTSTTLVSDWDARRVGVVIGAGDTIEIELDPEAPRNQALSATGLLPFPRIGGYILVPTDLGATVGVITGLRIDNTTRPGDHTPVPLARRLLTATPVAEIRTTASGPTVEAGIESFPSIGDPAVVPTLDELRLVMVGVGAASDEGRIRFGTAAAATSIVVDLSIDSLFGRHVAVLGTTGSGKSNTVASLIRRTVTATAEASATPTPRFLVLDPNGEYAQALSDLPGFRHLVAEPLDEHQEQLTVPAWLWTIDEWATLLRASPGVQAPILRACISTLRWGAEAPVDAMSPARLAGQLHGMVARAIPTVHGMAPGDRRSLGHSLRTLTSDLTLALTDHELDSWDHLSRLLHQIDQRRASGNGWYDPFSIGELQSLLALIATLIEDLGGHAVDDRPPIDTTAPIAFDVASLAHELRREARARGEADNIEPLAMRVQALLQDEVARRVLAPTEEPANITEWLTSVLGDDDDPSVTVLDLSLLPSDLTHVAAAVLARFVFEAHHRHLREQQHVAPTVLVLDEAHRFVQARAVDEDALSAAARCRAAFSRIAREGRKFGLGLVIASQRPSEVAPGILSQCGTYIVHRLSHERDLHIVHTAMAQGGTQLGKQLPALPTGTALLGGWAVRTPQLIRVDLLPEQFRPRSADPPYWDEWTATPPRGQLAEVATRWNGHVETP